ncbi:MAG: NMT1/THI5-like protein, partial [Rhodospirillales bacterium]|nr:NMT1/THI5-like protein [Rhodospirillales bacterium]
LSQAVQAKAAEVVSDLTEFVPPGGSIVPLVYSQKFATDKPAARAFMKAYIQGVRVYNDALLNAKDTDKVIGIIARYAKVDSKMIRESYPAGLDPNQHLNAQFLKTVQDFFITQRMLRAPADIEQLVDTTYADVAVKDLGEYR